MFCVDPQEYNAEIIDVYKKSFKGILVSISIELKMVQRQAEAEQGQAQPKLELVKQGIIYQG